mgnify:CR=1 FL=1
MATIDYAKYSNMSERQLLNSLLNAEKKEAKLRAEFQEKIKNSTELIKFLKAKLNEKLNKDLSDKKNKLKSVQLKLQESEELIEKQSALKSWIKKLKLKSTIIFCVTC